MAKKEKLLLKFVVFGGVFVLPIVLHAAIYRPTASDAQSLVNTVTTALGTAADDVIDLQGSVYLFADACDVTSDATDNDNCSDANALPIITGGGGKLSIINGAIERKESAASNFRLIQVDSEASLTLFNITLRNGLADTLSGNGSDNTTAQGGAIVNGGTLDLQNCTMNDNQAGQFGGGAIYNLSGGTMAMQSSNISGNKLVGQNDGNGNGGGINNDGVIETISNSTISYNTATDGDGGGISNNGFLNHMFNTTIAHNTTTGNGGGILNLYNSTVLQITNCTIASNMAAYGAGIYNAYAPKAQLGTRAIKINDDVPDKSSGVYIYNTTISKNQATSDGGGIYNYDDASASLDAIIAEIYSTIIGVNTASSGVGPDFFGNDSDDVLLEGYNIINNDANSTAEFSEDNFSILNVNPQVEDLAFNEGFTATMALMTNSPAINRGINPYELLYDQRRQPFARVKCGVPDIGSFEVQSCFSD